MAARNPTEEPKSEPQETVFIQEPKKTRGEVGEKLWGPYKAHAGSDITSRYAGGPWGLGDPEDKTLRKVEKDILIPNMMKRDAKAGRCKAAYDTFFKCAEDYGYFRMTYKCRPQANALKDCVREITENKEEIEKATQQYLDMRAEYRRTGKRLPLKRTG